MEKSSSSANDPGKTKKEIKGIQGTEKSLMTGRKMKSPPVDIFVSGLPKDTEEEDIACDLAASGIHINV